MISIFSYLITVMGIIFWGFRVVVTLLFQLRQDFFAVPLNFNMEVVLLFLTIPCLIFVVKRNIVGAAVYLALYVTYFGTDLYNNFLSINSLNIVNSTNLLIDAIGVILPTLIFLDILVNRNRTLGKGEKKADWFYSNKDYDREHDKRDDRNQYKF